ncbi:MAG: MBOAT family protein [Erysipelotrichaceae bacterium]|nr:MBOAT family protein [Erysipelotrichaceae bacterium]
MMYSTLTFFVFATLGILGFYTVPYRFRKIYLIGLNAYFCIGFGWKHYAWLMIVVLWSYIIGKIIEINHSKFWRDCGISLIVLSLFIVKFGSVFGIQSLFVPIGYSFYGLQIVSFLFDLQKGKIQSYTFSEYVCIMTFFPLLLQGPICRFEMLRKQINSPVRFDEIAIKSGMLLMLFGIFKKVVIADRLSIFVSDVFTNYQVKSGGVILIAVVFYAFQLYTDFSGCTDISRGVSECLGIHLPANFNNPYFSLSVKEFWNRWHISLSTWLKDYVYIPLGGNRKGTIRKYINLFLTFFVSGLWHGTGLQYLIWGGLQALGQVLEWFFNKWFTWYNRVDSLIVQLVRRCYMTVFTLGSWLVFRAHGVRAAVLMALKVLTGFFSFAGILECGLDQKDLMLSFALIVGLLVVDFIREKKKDVRQTLNAAPYVVQCLVFMILIFGIFVFGIYGSGYSASDFIYMQF